MRVGVQGYGDGGVTEKLLHYLRVYCKPWFDPETGTLMLGEYVVEMDSYRRIVEDQAVADAELDAETQRVTSLLRQLEEALSTEAAVVATEALCELAVLNALQVKRLQAASVIPQ